MGRADGAAAGRIGPNAVTRLAEALGTLAGPEAVRQVFEAADAASLLDAPPEAMVDDDVVARLYRALRQSRGEVEAGRAGALAGRLTADYLVGRRIPAPMRRLLPRLPPRLAMRVLFLAVARHAWTFAGRGRFAWWPTPDGVAFEVEGGPVARFLDADRPVCAYYAATFARLAAEVASAPVTVEEVACEAAGAPACRFHLVVGRRQERRRRPGCQKVSGGGSWE